MAGEIDLYAKLLDIPPLEQPPHHYRLLGVDLFEDRPEAINAAVLQRSARVRQYQAGPLGELAAKLLTEIATAQACLLDANRRAKYDVELLARLTPAAPQSPAAPPTPQATPAAVQAMPAARSVAQRYALSRRQRGRQRRTAIVLVSSVLIVVVVWLIARALFPTTKPPAPTAKPASEPGADAELREPKNVEPGAP